MGGKPRPKFGVDVCGDGQLHTWEGVPGISRRSGWPRRIVHGFDFTCGTCRAPYAMWMTDWKIWAELPKELWRARLCVRCFQFIVRLARKSRAASQWWRRDTMPSCMQCDDPAATLPEDHPRFCSMACATQWAGENSEGMRYCAKEHGWWDKGWYGNPPDEDGCYECVVAELEKASK